MRKLFIVLLLLLPVTFLGCKGNGCPKGQHSEFQYFQHVWINNVDHLIPIYACKPNR